jgi:predicted phosphoribosyltransferase
VVAHLWYGIAAALGADVDVLIVRKLGVPGAEELAMGAVAPGATLLNPDLVARLGIPSSVVDVVVARALAALKRREQAYPGNRPPSHVRGRTVILVDDGLATGATAQAAVESLRRVAARPSLDDVATTRLQILPTDISASC